MYNDDKKITAGGFFGSGLGGFVKGIIWAFVLTFILLAVGALIITYTSLSEDMIPVISLSCVVVSVAIGGMTAAKTADSKGYLKGSLCGVTYILVLYIVASLVSEKFVFTSHTALLFIIGVTVGALGGIIGINSGRKRKR